MRILDAIPRISGIVSMVAVLVLMILISADVGMRGVFNKPITGTIEIAELLMVVIVFFGLSWTTHKEMHIKVDLLFSLYSKRVQKIILIFNYSLALVLTALLCWVTFEETKMVKLLGLSSAYIEVPKYPFYAVAAIGWGCFLVTIIRQTVVRIKGDETP